MPLSLAFLGSIGPWEIFALLALGLLIFGKRLPEVGKSLGKGIVEFKKGLGGIEDDIGQAGQRPADAGHTRRIEPPPPPKLDAEEQSTTGTHHHPSAGPGSSEG